jgi:predicted sugar kinase
MLIEVGAPCCLPLGLVRSQSAGEEQVSILGITLQHPPVDLFAEAAPTLSVTGPRADLGFGQAKRFLRHHRLEERATVEIELAIPAGMGLGSAGMLGLSLARALSWVHGLRHDDTLALARAVGVGPEHALEVWGFDRGGVLLVDTETGSDGVAPPLRRHSLLDQSYARAWAFVLLLPRQPGETADPDAGYFAKLRRAAPYLSTDSGQLLEDALWPALERDDIAAFGQALTELQALYGQALAQAGLPALFSAEEQTALAVMREHDAVASGRSLAGAALYGLYRGAAATMAARETLSTQIGYYGGRVLATITDNEGARHTLRDMRPVG